MNMTRRILILLMAGFVAAMFSPTVAAETNPISSQCNMPETALAAFARFIALRLHNHDPNRAAALTKVTTAIVYGQTATVMQAINSGLSPNTPVILNAPPEKPDSLLGVAVAACQYEVVKGLVEAGASVNGVGGAASPLVGAVDDKEIPIAEYLIQKGADVNAIGPASGESLLASAVLSRQPAMVKLLLDHGANPNGLTARGRTLLDITSRSPNSVDQEIANMLRAHGAR